MTVVSHSIPPNAIRDLFKGVVFFINDTIPPKIRLALEDLLIEWGATKCPLPPSPLEEEEEDSSSSSKKSRFDSSRLTHLITDTLDFPEYNNNSLFKGSNEVVGGGGSSSIKGKGKSTTAGGGEGGGLKGDDKIGDGKIKIVTPAWVTRSFDLQVLQQSRFYSPDPALFLSGTCICTSGLPISDDMTVCTATEAFGGQWRRELTREVTHLICVSESGKKYEMAIKFGTELGIAIVLPHWFEESLKLNQLVPMDIYRFPSPPFTTTLRSTTTTGTKPFVERLTDYWKSRLLLTTSNPQAQASTSTSNLNKEDVPPTTIPKTSTFVILGLEEGLTVSTEKRLKESEIYFKSCCIQEGFPNSGLSRELSNGSLINGGAGRSASNRSQQVLNSLNSHSDDGVQGTGKNKKRRKGGIFEGKKFYLASDLGLSSGIEKAIVLKILKFGAESVWSFGLNGDGQEDDDDSDSNQSVVVEGKGSPRKKNGKRIVGVGGDSWEKRRLAEKKLRESDFVVLRNREGWEYWLSYSLSSTSTSSSISIGTPSWLFYTFSHQSLTSPLSRLVHYPPPSRDGVDGFRDKTITVSNYTGLAREYVRTLIELLGAKYEGTMGRNTDFVVTASDIGSKCQHAKTWNIPLVTHLWLESCVLSWSLLSPALSPNYTVISSSLENGTMFPTILGWRSWTKEAIEKWNESEERREERERGKKGVEELEREEQLTRGGIEGELKLQQEQQQGDEEMMVVVQEEEGKENIEMMEEENRVNKPEKIPVQQKNKPIKSKDKELVPVVEIDTRKKKQNDEVEESKSNGNEKVSSRSKTTNKDDQVEPTRARSKSTKLASPVRPAPSPTSEEQEEKTPPVRSKSTTVKKEKSSKPPPPPAAPITNGQEEDSSALSENSTSSSSEEEEKKPQISKHFNQIDPHNLVPLGSRRAAAVRGQAKLHDVIEDKNKFDLEQKKNNSSAKKAGTRRSSQGGNAADRGESGSPLKRNGGKKKKVKSEEESDVEMEELEEEEEEKPVVQKKGSRGKTKRASTEDGDQEPTKKKAKVVNKNLKSVKQSTTGGEGGDSTTQEGGAISSFDNPPKAKPSSIKTKKVRIISTGLGLEKSSSEIRDLKPLGVSWTDKPQEATHLVVKNLSRTEKFLCALPYAPFIVTKKWIDACIDAKELVDETPYLLKDKKKEQELGETLETILNRARNEGKVFDGKTIYITKGVSPGLPTMQRIVQASGGTIGLNDLKKQHKLILEDPEALVVSSPNERREWEKLASEGIPIYSCEAVFVATMHQVLDKGFNSNNRVDPQLLA